MSRTLQPMDVPCNVHIGGDLSCKNFIPPESCIGSKAIDANDPIEGAKTVHRVMATYFQPNGTGIVAATVPIHIGKGTDGATGLNLHAAITGALATGDHTVTIDVKKANTGAGPTSLLAAPLVLNNLTPLYGPIKVNLTDDLDDDDVVLLYITVAGATGVQAQGLVVRVSFDEDPV